MVKTKFSIALHILSILALYKEDWHTSANIADSLNVNSAIVRKELKALKDGRLIESKEGKNGGVRLLKEADKISLSDVFKLVKGDQTVLSHASNAPDSSCRIGSQINTKLAVVLEMIDKSILKGLKKQNLKDFIKGF